MASTRSTWNRCSRTRRLTRQGSPSPPQVVSFCFRSADMEAGLRTCLLLFRVLPFRFGAFHRDQLNAVITPEHVCGFVNHYPSRQTASDGSTILTSGAQYQSSPSDSVSEVSARGQHAHREKHDGDDADVRKLPPHLGHRFDVAATGDPGRDSGRTARPLNSQFSVKYAFSIVIG